MAAVHVKATSAPMSKIYKGQTVLAQDMQVIR